MQNERLGQSREVDVFSELAEQKYAGEKREEWKNEEAPRPVMGVFGAEVKPAEGAVVSSNEVVSEIGAGLSGTELMKEGELSDEGVKVVEEIIKKNEDNPYQLAEEIEALSQKVRGR